MIVDTDSICNSSSRNVSNPKNTAFEHERRHIPSASSALIIGSVLGLIQALFLIFGAKPVLSFMGVNSVSIFLVILGYGKPQTRT